ncbi:retrotransposon protein, putative, ty1-copia subclass [Tanacetum coccineum]
MWKGKRPSLGYIKIWGCEVFVRGEAQDKLEARSEKCLFVGYPKELFRYLFYKPKDNVVFVARRGVFLEREMISKEDSGIKIDLVEIQETSRVSKPPQDPQFYYGFHIEEDKISDSILSELDEPANYKGIAMYWNVSFTLSIGESSSAESWRRSLAACKNILNQSQSGWVFLLNGGAVTWRSSKQNTMADSTWESEYIAAIALTKEPKDHGKSKHIDKKYHFVQSKVAERHVIVKDIRSEDNPADPFTKALAKSKHDEHAKSIGLKDKIETLGVRIVFSLVCGCKLLEMSSENGVNPPAPNPSHNSSFSLLSVLGRERLTGPNYMDWMRNLRFTLRYENKEYVLDEQIPTINDNSTQDEIEAHQKHYDDANKVSCIMASSMSPELQKTFEFTWAYEMNQQLKEMFQAKASKERLDVVKSLMACKPKPGASICAFVLEMKGYFDRLESLNMVFDAELSINIILSGLPADYNQFVLSYQMNEKDTSIMELQSLLQTAEQGIKRIDVPFTSKAPVLTVGHNAKKRKTSHSNWKGKAAKGKSDRGSKRKAKSEIAPTSDPKEAVCFYCNTKGHWKRSCPNYLKDLKDGKVEKGSHSGMFMIELHNTTTSDSWLLDTGCGTYICTVLQGLKESRRLKHGELNLVMGNRNITPMTRIGEYELMLKSGDGYKFLFDNENGDIVVYSNGCFMFKASPCKGIYETVECISHNDNVILNVGSSNKLDKSKLWHCRLGRINKKRMPNSKRMECLNHLTSNRMMGGEYLSIEFFDHLKNCGIVSQLTPPRTPQLNGVVERRNRTLLDMVRYMMCPATLPISFWGYALETATHILNLVPTKKVSKTPFRMWKGKRPSLGHIKIWGCVVFVRREAQDKLEARSEKCLFVGYLKELFRYLFYKPKDNVVFVARRGVFLEREMISKEDSLSKIDIEEIQESVDEEPIVNIDSQQEVVTPVEPNDVSLPIRRTSRVSKPPQDPQFYYGFHIEEDKISDSILSELGEPANYKEAMASPEAAK